MQLSLYLFIWDLDKSWKIIAAKIFHCRASVVQVSSTPGVQHQLVYSMQHTLLGN